MRDEPIIIGAIHMTGIGNPLALPWLTYGKKAKHTDNNEEISDRFVSHKTKLTQSVLANNELSGFFQVKTKPDGMSFPGVNQQIISLPGTFGNRQLGAFGSLLLRY